MRWAFFLIALGCGAGQTTPRDVTDDPEVVSADAEAKRALAVAKGTCSGASEVINAAYVECQQAIQTARSTNAASDVDAARRACESASAVRASGGIDCDDAIAASKAALERFHAAMTAARSR